MSRVQTITQLKEEQRNTVQKQLEKYVKRNYELQEELENSSSTVEAQQIVMKKLIDKIKEQDEVIKKYSEQYGEEEIQSQLNEIVNKYKTKQKNQPEKSQRVQKEVDKLLKDLEKYGINL